MSNPGAVDATPITSKRQLVDYLAAGCKPREQFRIGTEHEKFGFRHDNLVPPAYAPDGIRAVLEALAAAGGGAPIYDGDNLIGLKRDTASISLEPAGQLELSGGMLDSLHATKAELTAHLQEVRRVGERLGIGFAPLGFHPIQRREQMPWMPKRRYAIMRGYMPRVGGLGLDMMTRTCTVQVNLDFCSEADMARKLRVGLLLQTVATALFANSPFTEGKPNGYLSYRAHVWTDTDPDRTGIPAAFLEPGFGFAEYVEWLLDVPMYFITRNNRYIDLTGRSFRRFLEGGFADAATGPATLGDFADHLTTAFPEVRVKRYLDMRGADAGSPEMMLAQLAFWVGLLYDASALAAAEALLRRYPASEFLALRQVVPRLGLAAPWQRGRLADLAREVVAIAADGLAARGRDERGYLAPLEALAAGEPTQAERWLERYRGPWAGDIRRIFAEAAI
jgi:glutamate--cysteine ligase